MQSVTSGAVRVCKKESARLMKTIIGIDVGGSTTKICGFRGDKLLEPLLVKATDPVASVYGGFGKFTAQTGVGSAYISEDIYGITTQHVSEFVSTGRGGLYLTGIGEAIIVSMGTGTALVHAKGKNIEYLGGTGIGGGTLIGLSKKILGVQSVDIISQLAENGDLNRVDLRIGDITDRELSPTLLMETTAANFGKVSDIATQGDLAMGILNLVFETIAMMSIFAARSHRLKDIILTGNLTAIKQSSVNFESTGKLFGFNFRTPEHSQYATVIGAALTYFD